MAQFYNALIRMTEGEESKIIGSAFITQNTKLPSSCVLTYGRKHFNAGTEEAVKYLHFASPTKPLQVYLNGIPKPANPVKLDIMTLTVGEVYEIEASETTKIEDLEILIERQSGIMPYMMRLICSGKQLEAEKTLADYKITSDSRIHLVQRLRGSSGTFWTVNLLSKTIHGVGIKSGDERLAFHPGLNILGNCSNKNCVTNQGSRYQAMIQYIGYPADFSVSKENIYKCNDCGEKFNIANFLVCNGRSRFLAGGGQNKIDRLVESLGNSFEYTMFYPIEINGGAHYCG